MMICPVCKEKLHRFEKTMKCANNHSFDIAKSGYVNLFITNSKNHGDNKEMVKARTSFLSTGSYQFLKDELVDITKKYQPDRLVDFACGEGYYTKAFQANEKIGIDLSKEALKYASKHDPTTSYILSSIFHTPLSDACCDMVITCFAPLAKDEIQRILKPRGIFVFVTPAENHLIEMKQIVYKNPYLNEMKDVEDFIPCIIDKVIQNTFTVTSEKLQDLYLMTPYAHTSSLDGIEKLKRVEALSLTAAFRVRVFQKI